MFCFFLLLASIHIGHGNNEDNLASISAGTRLSAQQHSVMVAVHPRPSVRAPYNATLEFSGESDFLSAAVRFANMHGLGSESIRPLVRRMMDSSGWLTTFKALHLSDEDISSSYDGSKLLIFVIWDAGLGRRLMRMASAFQLAKATGRKLLVYWIPNDHCFVRFDELFEQFRKDTNIRGRPERGISASDVEVRDWDPSWLTPSISWLAHPEKSQELPLIPIHGDNSDRISDQRRTTLTSAPILRLLYRSGQPFMPTSGTFAGWRALCHDFLASLIPVATLQHHAEQIMRPLKTNIDAAGSRKSLGVVGIHIRREEPGIDASDVCAHIVSNMERNDTIEKEDDGEGKSRTESIRSEHKDADADFPPLGWDEIPLTRYAELIQLIHYHRPHSVFLLLSNHKNALRRLRAMLPANVHLSMPQDTPSSDVADTESFSGRHRDAVLSAASEWLALASCSLIISSQGSAFSLTASMRGSGFAVVVAPGSGVAIVSTGEVDFLKPSSLIRSQYYANRCTDEHELRAWGLEENVLCIESGDVGSDSIFAQKWAASYTKGGVFQAHVARRLHVGRMTTAGTQGRESNHIEWTIVDVVPGPGIVNITGMDNLPFAANSFEVVYASHCLHHVSWEKVGAALSEWHRVLVRGGTLCVAVPDMVTMAKLIANPNNNIDDDALYMNIVFGAQRDAYDFHRSGFSEKMLTMYLRAHGFCGVRRVDDFHYFTQDSTHVYLANQPISLNLRAVAC